MSEVPLFSAFHSVGNVTRLCWQFDELWEGCRESRRCSRDTYPESYISKNTSIRRKQWQTSRMLVLVRQRLAVYHKLPARTVKRFRGGLVFKVHRWLYHSTLGSRVIKKKKTDRVLEFDCRQRMRGGALAWHQLHLAAGV